MREYTKDSLGYAFDTFAASGSTKICEEALSSSGGFYLSVSPVEVGRTDIKSDWVLGFNLCGEKFEMMDMKFPARIDLYRWYTDIFGPIVQSLVDKGGIKPHPISVREGGLHGVLEGLQEMREWKISGQKLVYRIQDTK